MHHPIRVRVSCRQYKECPYEVTGASLESFFNPHSYQQPLTKSSETHAHSQFHHGSTLQSLCTYRFGCRYSYKRSTRQTSDWPDVHWRWYALVLFTFLPFRSEPLTGLECIVDNSDMVPARSRSLWNLQHRCRSHRRGFGLLLRHFPVRVSLFSLPENAD